MAWVHETPAGARWRDCVICTCGRVSDAPDCITTSSSGGCAPTLESCLAVEDVTFDAGSANAPERELEG